MSDIFLEKYIVTWGSGARYSGVMYLSPPRPLVMITGHVSSVSTVISALVHHTCLTCLYCIFCIALGPRECGSLQGSCPVEDGIATDRVCCTAVHSLHGTLWAASVHTEHILSVRRLSLDPQVFWTKSLCSERNQGCSRHRYFNHNDEKYQGKKRS